MHPPHHDIRILQNTAIRAWVAAILSLLRRCRARASASRSRAVLRRSYNPKAQQVVLGPEKSAAKSDSDWRILARLALVTEGKSGRELKNIVTKATMRAIKRSAQEGVPNPVILNESDFACIS
jgi:SpoVK/Ycf46/Vps4 family AAA+-type ATPase